VPDTDGATEYVGALLAEVQPGKLKWPIRVRQPMPTVVE
jgi:hypothetical protein